MLSQTYFMLYEREFADWCRIIADTTLLYHVYSLGVEQGVK